MKTLSIPVLNFRNTSAPGVSAPGESRLYYDQVANRLMISTDGGPYTPLASGGDLGLDVYSDNVLISSDVIGLNFSSDFTLNEVDGVLEITSTFNSTIGSPEDGSYADGLFKDFTPSTQIGTAIDRFNEVLAALAPPPPPDLANISFTGLGTAGHFTFGPSNINTIGMQSYPGKDVNGNIAASSGYNIEKGIFGSTISTRGGVLADNVTAGTGSPSPAYPAKSFGDANVGLLQLWAVIGGVDTKLHEVDLSTFVSGNSLNANGSGFLNLSAANPVLFPSGTPLPAFQYRTGQWTLGTGPTEQTPGYNKVWVVHTNGVFTRTTNHYIFVNDIINTATTFFSGSETLSVPAMTGSKSISGVEYHTGGSAVYNITIENAYRNTYANSNALTFSGTNSKNISATAEELYEGPFLSPTYPPVANGTEASLKSIINKNISVSATRILNDEIKVATTVARTQTNLTGVQSPGAAQANLLLDNVADNATATSETFNGEKYRVRSNWPITDTNPANYPQNGSIDTNRWDSTNSLLSGAGYSDGLLVFNGKLQYPTNTTGTGITNGNFSAATGGPAGNPNYSGATGNRVYLRYFYNDTGVARFNFRLNVTTTTSPPTNFVPTTSPLNAADVHLEILAPNTTRDSGNNIVFKDARVARINSDNDPGALNGTYSPTNWPLTLGTKSTATSGNVIIIKITASSAWTGSIDNISLTWE